MDYYAICLWIKISPGLTLPPAIETLGLLLLLFVVLVFSVSLSSHLLSLSLSAVDYYNSFSALGLLNVTLGLPNSCGLPSHHVDHW